MKYFFLTFVIILASVVNALPPYVGDGRVTPLKSNNQVDECP